MNAVEDRVALAAAYLQAIRAAGNSDPNPPVGAVVVDAKGRTVASGFTQRAGYAHAERQALSQLGRHDLSGHTLYVTLEPCCHHGRTPPCVDAILERKISRVVIAERDFAAEVQGRSVALLDENGIAVTQWSADDFQREKWFTTGPFFFSRREGRPRVLLKWAQTAEGSLAPNAGPSGAISGRDAAFLTAALRFWCKLTVAAPGTVFADAPRLTVRPVGETPDLSQSGFSLFAWELLRTQHLLAAGPHDAETLRQSVRDAEQLLLWPESTGITGHGHVTARASALQQRLGRGVPRLDWKNHFRTVFENTLREILAEGFNSLLLEAGPNFSAQVIDHDYADAIAVYRSRARHDAELWGAAGRGNTLSRLLAREEKPRLPGYQLLEFARLDTDDFLLYSRADIR